MDVTIEVKPITTRTPMIPVRLIAPPPSDSSPSPNPSLAHEAQRGIAENTAVSHEGHIHLATQEELPLPRVGLELGSGVGSGLGLALGLALGSALGLGLNPPYLS